MLAGKNIVVGITGGVAAHYLPELIGQLRFRYLASVYAVMTPAATQFISPLMVAAATGTPVDTDIFGAAQRDPLAHIHLARLADLVLVAPATFDFIGKVAAGRADDPVSLLLAATPAPVLLAPAMHDTMWAKPILKRNIGILESVGYRIVPPETGIQASGESGEGRMASINGIIAALCEMTKIISEEEKG
jgi:phosphopantothenoylcysteine decarboxylase/phosphopantothenate--cysteine ligase